MVLLKYDLGLGINFSISAFLATALVYFAIIKPYVKKHVDGKNIYHLYYVLNCVTDGKEFVLTAPTV